MTPASWRLYTEPAKVAVWEAVHEARRFERETTELIHLASVLLRPSSGAIGPLLAAAGLPTKGLRDRLEAFLEDGGATIETPPLSRCIGNALLLAHAEADALDEHFYDTDHLLLGLVREEETRGGGFLGELGLESHGLRAIARSLRTGRAPEVAPDPPRTPAYAWDRYAEEARAILFAANDRVDSREGIHLLHLLHALLNADDPIIRRGLRRLGLSAAEIVREVERQRGWDASGADLFLSPAAKRLAEWASREAHGLGSPTIQPAHLLLGALVVDSISAAPFAAKFGVTAPRLREALRRSGPSEPDAYGFARVP